jgi:hypothetical protein
LDAGVPPALGDFLYAQKVTKDAHERGISISPSHDFSLEATQEGRPRPSWITPGGRETGNEGCSLRAVLLSFRAERGISHSEAYAIVDGDSSALTRLRMTEFLYILQIAQVSTPINHTSLSVEREIDAITMRLRATRIAVTTNGQGSRHGKQITRAAALVFFLVTFSKVKKPPGAGRNPASPVPPRGGGGIPAFSPVPPRGGTLRPSAAYSLVTFCAHRKPPSEGRRPSSKRPRCRTESCIPRPPAGRNPAATPAAGVRKISRRRRPRRESP